jgi:hypothetical protein
LEPHRSRITESAYRPCPYRNQLQLHNWRIYPIFETPYVFPMLLLTPNSNLTGLYLKTFVPIEPNQGHHVHGVCLGCSASPHTAQLIPKRTRSDPSSEYGWSFRKAKSGLFWTFDSETDKETKGEGFFAGQGGDPGSQRGSWGDIGGSADAYGAHLPTAGEYGSPGSFVSQARPLYGRAPI